MCLFAYALQTALLLCDYLRNLVSLVARFTMHKFVHPLRRRTSSLFALARCVVTALVNVIVGAIACGSGVCRRCDETVFFS